MSNRASVAIIGGGMQGLMLAFCLAVSAGVAFSSIVPSRVAAQGTPEQRAACEEEAKYLCANYIPDEQ